VSTTPTSSAPMKRAADRPDAANDDDDKGEDQHRFTHADLHRLQRAHHRAGQPGQRRAKRKDDCVKRPDVDAQRPDHLAVAFASADAHAEPCARDQEIESARNCQPNNNDRQPVKRIADASGQLHSASQLRRNVEIERERPEQPAGSFRKDQDQRKGRQHLVEMVAVIEPTDHGRLDNRARRRRRRQARSKPSQNEPLHAATAAQANAPIM
jgi:hypothetical protein